VLRELGGVTTDGIAGALVRYVNRRASTARGWSGRVLGEHAVHHLPDGPEQEERDPKLREFNGESDVSYDWL